MEARRCVVVANESEAPYGVLWVGELVASSDARLSAAMPPS